MMITTTDNLLEILIYSKLEEIFSRRFCGNAESKTDLSLAEQKHKEPCSLVVFNASYYELKRKFLTTGYYPVTLSNIISALFST